MTTLGTSFTDADLLKTPGVYYCSNLGNASNIPQAMIINNYAGQLFAICRGTDIRVFQILFVYIPSTTPKIFIRTQKSATDFSDWGELI